jgi:DNA primase
MSQWIDFKSLRKQLSFIEVLKHYGVQAKFKGDRAYALCPLPNHPAHRCGGARTASLSVNLTRNIFQCFGCKASGNVLDFCIRMEGSDPTDPKQFRSAAIGIADTFGISMGNKPMIRDKPVVPADTPQAITAKTPEPQSASSSLPVIVNAALDFELKHLDPTHPYLSARGFTPDTIQHFGLGTAARG